MDRAKAPPLDWQDGDVPVSRQFDDPYFALSDGAAETAHVFIAGNGLPGRFMPGFHIGELGFGTGLNLMVAWAAWETSRTAGPLQFTSFEAYPMPAEDMARALARWPEFRTRSDAFLKAFDDDPAVSLPGLEFRLIDGDARRTLPEWDGVADAWFLDGFSPAKNPELWEADLMEEVYRHTAPGGTFATYTAAGQVRRSLAAAGFNVERKPGFGHKRHMTRGSRA